MNYYQPRFENGVYRNCKWCGGKGCLACPAEAEKEYKRQFPDGPKPIATFKTADLGEGGISGLLKSLIGPEAIMAAKAEGAKRAAEVIASNPSVLDIAGCTKEQAEAVLGTGYAGEILHENIIKAGIKSEEAK